MKTTDTILKAIKSIETRGLNLDAAIQETACDVLQHVQQHGEVSLAIKLFNAMPASSRRSALVAFMVDNGKVKVNPDTKARKEFPFVLNKQGPDFSASKASTKPWYEYKKESDTQVFGEKAALKQIKGLRTKLLKAQSNGESIEDPILKAIMAMSV